MSDMTGSSQSNIKDQEEQSKLSGHLIADKIRTMMLEKDKNVERLFQSERIKEEMRE